VFDKNFLGLTIRYHKIFDRGKYCSYFSKKFLLVLHLLSGLDLEDYVSTRPVATGGIRGQWPQILLCPEKFVLNIY